MAGPSSKINRDIDVVSGAGTNSVVLIVPAGERWLVHSVGGSLDTDTGVGNRNLACESLSAADAVLQRTASDVDVPVDQTVFYQFGTSVRDAAIDNNSFVTPLAPFVLMAGEKLKVYDIIDVDSTNDTLTVRASIDKDYDAV